jgi:hypothetical protein
VPIFREIKGSDDASGGRAIKDNLDWSADAFCTRAPRFVDHDEAEIDNETFPQNISLNQEINAVLADPGIKNRLDDLGNTPATMSPAEFGKFIAGEIDKWATVIKTAGIKAE